MSGSSKDQLNSLISDYVPGKISRRDFLRRAIALGVSIPAATSILANLASKVEAQDAMTPVSGGVFTEGYDRDFSKMDTVQSGWADPAYVALYEFIMIRDPEGKPAPALAESWEISEDGLTWTFKIRDGLKFHSGAPCTAANVVEDFELFRDTATGQNAVFWAPVTGVAEGENNSVVVSLSKPFAAFPETLATEYSMIHNQAVRAELGDQYGAQQVDGTGPFTLTEFSPGNQVRVTRWDDYAGTIIPFVENKGVAYVDEVRWVPILEPANRANEIETGGVHAVKNPAPQDVARLQGNPDLVVTEFPALANFYIGLNQTKTSLGFDDLRVRQAISHAIDRAGIANALFFGKAVATYGPIANNWKWYEPGVEQFNQFDAAASAALLDEAGWALGGDGIREKDGVKLSFTVQVWKDQSNASPIAEAIGGMLAAVGIEMKIQVLEAGEFFGGLNEDLDAFGFEWLWSAPLDVIILFNVFPTPAFTGAHADVTAAFEEYQGALDDAGLEEASRKAQLLWAEKLPSIPVVTTYNIWAHHKSVHGWTPYQSMLYPLYNDVWLEQ